MTTGALQALILPMAMWVGVALIAGVAAAYFLRPRVRAHYPGGAKRYLTALFVQAAGFMVPIPVVLFLLLGAPIPQGLDVVIAVAVGFGVILIMKASPVTGPLLKDLRRARIEAMVERLGPRT